MAVGNKSLESIKWHSIWRQNWNIITRYMEIICYI